MYAVFRDGYQECEFTTLEMARELLKTYKGRNDFYVVGIYSKNQDGSISWVEGR